MPADRLFTAARSIGRRHGGRLRCGLRLAPLALGLLLVCGCGSANPSAPPVAGAAFAAIKAAGPWQPAGNSASTPAATPSATASPQPATPAVSATPDPTSLEAALATLDLVPATPPAGSDSGWANEGAAGGWGAAAAPTATAPTQAVRPGPKYWGVATYYGADFQGQPMAAGPAFDMRDPTVTASNSWPLGTRLRITRIPGGPWDALLTVAQRQYYFGHSIVVTVMDRGAFTHALDLSWGAFAQLGNPAEGVIRVLIEPVDGVPPVKGLRGTPAGPDL